MLVSWLLMSVQPVQASGVETTRWYWWMPVQQSAVSTASAETIVPWRNATIATSSPFFAQGPIMSRGISADFIGGGLLCVGCGVLQSAASWDPDTLTYSTIQVGLAVGSNPGLRVTFPGTYENGDVILIDLEIPAATLSANVLSNITVTPRLGNAAGVTTSLNNLATVRLLGASVGAVGRMRVRVPVTQQIDRVDINIGTLLSALGGLLVYDVRAMVPVSVTPNPTTVPYGNTATFTASTRLGAGPVFNWYASPTGGSPLVSTAGYTTPALTRSSNYYVDATLNGATTERVAASVLLGGGPGPLWTYGDRQESPIYTGLACVGCTVADANLAADGDPNTSSLLTTTVGALGNVGQLIRFPGTYQAGDSIALDIEVPGQLLTADLLSDIIVRPYNGNTPTADSFNLNNSLVRAQVLGIGSTGKVRVTLPASAAFDGVRISTGSGISVLGGLRVYEAVAFMPLAITPPSQTVPYNTTASMSASVRAPGATYTWYDAPTGGNVVGTSASLTTPPLQRSTTFYAEAATPDGKTSFVRTAAPVTVGGAPGPLWTYADRQESPVVTPVCVGCTVQNPNLAVDGDTTTASQAIVTVGALGAVGELLHFPGTYQAGDSITFILGVPAQTLSAQLLSGIRVQTYNGSTPNGDAISLDNDLLNVQALGLDIGGNVQKFRVTVPATATFDGARVDLTGTVAALSSLNIYEAAAHVPVTVTPNPATAAFGSTTTLNAAIRFPDATFTWYDAPTGGNVVGTGATLTTPVLVQDRTFYVEAATPSDGKISFVRTAVPVDVTVGPSSPDLACGAGVSQTNATLGVCLLCAVTNPELAVDQNPQTASNLHVPVGLINGSAYQRIAFGQESTVGDSLRIVIGSTTGLLNLSLLGNVTIRPRNNGVENAADVRPVNSGLLSLQLLDGGARASITFAPAAVFDEVEFRITGIATALTQVDLYYAQQITARAAVASDTANVCTGQTATLTANGPAGATFRWYDAPSGGNLLASTASYTTPAITADAVYYVEAVSPTTTCKSEVRQPVFVKVGLASVSVTATSVTIARGQTATFNVNTPDPALNYNWYTVPSGGTPVFTGPTFTTPPLNATTTYYVEAATTTGCASAQRIAVIANVLIDNPDVPCDYATTQISTTSGLCLGCYVENQGSAIDASTTTFSTIHTVVGLLGGYAQQTLIFPSASDPLDSIRLLLSVPGTLADVGLLGNINIATYNGTTFNNDRVALNSSLLQLALLPGNQQLMVTFAPTAQFDRVEVRLNSGVATALNAFNVHYAQRFVPVPDLTPDTVSTCSGATATLNVTARANTLYRWYSTPTGGTSLATGTTFTSGPVTTDTAFYVEAVKTTTGCANPIRARAVVTLGAPPAAPTVDNANINTCSGTSAVLKATGPAGATFRWYNQQTGGAPLFTGAEYTTPALDSSAVFYAEAVSAGGCASATRTAVTVSVSGRPGTPDVLPAAASICVGGTATLTATSATAGAVFNWYDSPAMTNLLFTGAAFTTPALSATTTYYVVAANGQCVSATPREVTVTVNAAAIQPTITAAPTGTVDYGQTVNLTASSATPGATYNWYLDATGGSPVATGAQYTTPSLADTTTFYVEAVAAGGCASARASITINVKPAPLPPCDFANDQASPIVTGVCVLCAVTSPALAVDLDTTTASRINVTVGALGTIGQLLYFSDAAPAGDTIRLKVAVPGSLLDATLLGGITIESYNGATPNGDAQSLTSSVLRVNLLNGGAQAIISFAPQQAYTALKVSIGGAVAALSSVDVYYAHRILSPPVVTVDNANICAGGQATLTATSSSSATIRWYDAAIGGTLVHTGNVFTTAALTTATTYYAEAMRTANNCANPNRTPVTIRVQSVPDVPQILKGDTTICAGGSALLAARAQNPNHSIRWFGSPAGGTALSLDSVYNTGALTASKTFYAEAFNGTCGSATRVAVNVTVTTPPVDPIPESNSVSVCTGTSATLRATTTTAGAILRWYNVQTGGTPLAQGTSFTTPPITATTLYYVEAIAAGGGCPNGGGRIQITVNANTTPAVPVVADGGKTVCNGEPTTLSILNPVPGITYNWYDAPGGGTLQGSGATFTTPALTADKTYYVEAVAGGNCASTTRATAQVTVRTSISAPTVASANVTVCRGSQATLSVSNPDPGLLYNWYDAPGGNKLFTGATFLTGVQVANASYYVEAATAGGCRSNTMTRVDVTVTDAPINPVVVGNTTICQGDALSLSIQNPGAGLTYRWYTVASGGTPVSVGATFAPTNVTTSTTFFVEAVSGACTSPGRTSVTVTVNPAPAPVTVDAAGRTVCIGNTTTLHVSNPTAGLTYRWYDALTGGNLLGSGADFTTPALTANRNFFVVAVNGNNCAGLARTEVAVTVTTGPALPAVAAEVTVCRGLRPTVRVNNARTDLRYRWYDAPIGGTLLFVGDTYTTADPLTNRDTVYVEATLPDGTCTSNGRSQVILIVADAPATPVFVNGNTVATCVGSTATFTIQNPTSNLTYRWYDTNGNLLQNSASATYTTGVLTANMDVFVEAVIGGTCASGTRAKGTANVNGNPVPPTVTPDKSSVCMDSSTVIRATSNDAGVTFKWYTSATGGTPIFTGPAFTTPALRAAATYYVEAAFASGCASATRTAVTINILSQLAAPAVVIADKTATSVTFRWDPVAGALGYQVSVNDGTPVNPTSGLTGTTHTITNLQPNQKVSVRVMTIGASTCANSAWFLGEGGTDNPAGNTIFVPNAFTPNNDGVNDVLYVYGTTIASMEMRVYNQWGQLVFESKDKARGWDGTMSGTRQPVGVYNYALKATLQDGTTVTKRGTITLIR
ncbi:Ig-like domain-containing protein [Chitinophaga lutea]